MMIYHITARADWEKAVQTGQYTAPSLEKEGFIHASTFEQVAATANLFFHGMPGLVLLVIDTRQLLPPLRFDPVASHGDIMEFPHIYGPINLSAVVDVLDFAPGEDGSFKSPAVS